MSLRKDFTARQFIAHFQSIDFQSPFNLVSFYLGGEHQIDDYLKDVTVVNTDDNVWLEHRIPMDLLDPSHGNLYFMLRSKIKDDNRKSLRQIFPGISMERLDTELAALSKDGDLYYEKAEKAKHDRDFATMEEYYRKSFSDFNSKFYYPAGLKLAEHLHSQHRTEEALSVTATLQRNFPAFPDAYLLEARIRIQTGQSQKAKEAVNRGLMYNPDNQDLKKLLGKI